MNQTAIFRLAFLLSFALLLGQMLLGSAPASAIEFDEVRDFDDVFVISAAATARDRIEIRWDIEDDYYL